jgi:DNA-binding response OmpR family regulator
MVHISEEVISIRNRGASPLAVIDNRKPTRSKRTESAAAARAIVAAVHVLLIDSDSDDAYLVRRELERYGIEVEWAAGFDEGVEAFEARRFDAVLVDHHLGARTGLEFVRFAGSHKPGIPVILITGLDSQEVDDAALEAGAAGFVLKDDARGDLLSRTIRYAVRASRAHPPMPRQESRPKPGGKDLTLQVALSRGMTIRDAAKAAGMSERTAYRRMNDPVFQEQLSALESELRQRMVDRTVEDILNTES